MDQSKTGAEPEGMMVLFGAGTTGRVIARHLRESGRQFVFADNDMKKQGTMMEGVEVMSPAEAETRFPDAKWICCAMQPTFREQIMADLARLGVEVLSTWDFMDRRTALPSQRVWNEVTRLSADEQTDLFLWDQLQFRKQGSKYQQVPPSPASNIYFESFITKRDDEHYVDCGAADGDTVEMFRKWTGDKYARITTFEPDGLNYEKLSKAIPNDTHLWQNAVSDHNHYETFVSYGDYSSHLGDGNREVFCVRLDTVEMPTPTFIKMDIEGSELEALWGARDLIRTHSPVLAVCAYHSADHLWRIPLLVHALNPDYRIFLRRYAEETWELVFYAVPESRLA